MRFNQIRRKKYERKFRRKEILDKKRLGRMRENIKFLAVFLAVFLAALQDDVTELIESRAHAISIFFT